MTDALLRMSSYSKEKRVNFFPYAFLSTSDPSAIHYYVHLCHAWEPRLPKGLQHTFIKPKHGLMEGFSFFICLHKGYPVKTSYDYFPYILKKLFCIGIKLQSWSGAVTWHNDRLLYQSYLWTLFTEAPKNISAGSHSILRANIAKNVFCSAEFTTFFKKHAQDMSLSPHGPSAPACLFQ